MKQQNLKNTLKKHIAFSPRERRIQLEKFVDNEMLDEDILYSIKYVEDANSNGNIHSVTKLNYSDGNFSISVESGVTTKNKKY